MVATLGALGVVAHTACSPNPFVWEAVVVSASVVESRSVTLFVKVIARDHNGYYDCNCDPPHAHGGEVNLKDVKTRGVFSDRVCGLRCHYPRVLDRSRTLISHNYF